MYYNVEQRVGRFSDDSGIIRSLVSKYVVRKAKIYHNFYRTQSESMVKVEAQTRAK